MMCGTHLMGHSPRRTLSVLCADGWRELARMIRAIYLTTFLMAVALSCPTVLLFI